MENGRVIDCNSFGSQKGWRWVGGGERRVSWKEKNRHLSLRRSSPAPRSRDRDRIIGASHRVFRRPISAASPLASAGWPSVRSHDALSVSQSVSLSYSLYISHSHRPPRYPLISFLFFLDSFSSHSFFSACNFARNFLWFAARRTASAFSNAQYVMKPGRRCSVVVAAVRSRCYMQDPLYTFPVVPCVIAVHSFLSRCL